MEDYSPERFGERIKRELERTGMHLQPFQEDIERRTGKIRGTSYGAVWGYVNGKGPPHPPRAEIVDAMAEALGVLPGYLLHGGPRTEFEAKVEAATEPEPDPEMDRFRERMYERVPFLRYMDADRSIEAHFLRVSMGFTAANRRLGLSDSEGGYEAWEAACDFINEYITAPLDYWYDKHGRTVRMEGETFALYVEAVLHALRLSLQAEVSPDSETEADNGEA
jgi:transcriptional regulator with XRE-family HTH domain